MKPKQPFAVSMTWMNGARTINQFGSLEAAQKVAQGYAELYPGNCVYLGTLVEQATETNTEV